MRRLTVSIVIPAYNEENHLRICLQAIARQTVRPLEVIVVDNNSNDATAAIARAFPFVRVVHEKRRGVMYARDLGFTVARGDIIGRLDADSVVEPNWVETIQKLFSQDKHLAAATGTVRYREVCLPQAFNAIDFSIRKLMARRGAPHGEQVLQGVNLAIRKEVWQAVQSTLCHTQEHHEDLDLSAHLSQRRYKVQFVPAMIVTNSGRRADSRPGDFYRYVMSNPRTLRTHHLKITPYVQIVAVSLTLLYPAMRICYRGYNPATGRFSLRCLVWPEVATNRVSPVAPVPSDVS